ncbi:MAG: DnaJ domain-containing protein [Eubacteriaceae bacterium]|nr:DnaJ domain-containing protein [Eubacteriaceae bacterium]
MNLIKKPFGLVLLFLVKVISVVLDGLTGIFDFIVNVVNTIAKSFIAFIGIGGFLLFFMFAGPLGIYLLFNPAVILTVLFLVFFPILGRSFVSYLKYINHTLTEYLSDLANSLVMGKLRKYKTLSEYKIEYKRVEAAKRQEEQQRRQAQQQRAWEEHFSQWQNSQQSQHRGGYTNSGGFEQNFHTRYRESCDLLGVDYSSDSSQIKAAYRKKAKEYHPDINSSSGATKMFQKINDAYEFLSESNIERYRKAA